MGRLNKGASTVDAGLGEIVGVVAGRGGTDGDAHVGGGVGVVQVGVVPWAFYIMMQVLSTQALLSGFQY